MQVRALDTDGALGLRTSITPLEGTVDLVTDFKRSHLVPNCRDGA